MLKAPSLTSAQSIDLSVRTGPRPTLMCFSHLRWDFVTQRPQHLMRRAARSHDVIFMEEPTFDDVAAPTLDRRRRDGGVEVLTPRLPHGASAASQIEMQRAMLRDVVAARGGPLTLWFYTPMALAFADDVAAELVVYDCMDELSHFAFAPKGLRSYERRLMAQADLVFCGGRSLFEAKRALHADVHLFPSSVDAAHFSAARTFAGPEPVDQAGIDRPRVGFFGVVDERLDLDLVDELSSMRPDWALVMVGPVCKIDPSSLPRRANIHWLGPKDYADLPAYLAGWDAGFMPFALNDATRYISPTKTPEFLAAGVPVVSTPVRDVVHGWGDAGLVEIAADAHAFACKLEALFAHPRDEWRREVDARIAGMSWDATFGSMLALMRSRATRAAARDAQAVA